MKLFCKKKKKKNEEGEEEEEEENTRCHINKLLLNND